MLWSVRPDSRLKVCRNLQQQPENALETPVNRARTVKSFHSMCTLDTTQRLRSRTGTGIGVHVSQIYRSFLFFSSVTRRGVKRGLGWPVSLSHRGLL